MFLRLPSRLSQSALIGQLGRQKDCVTRLRHLVTKEKGWNSNKYMHKKVYNTYRKGKKNEKHNRSSLMLWNSNCAVTYDL